MCKTNADAMLSKCSISPVGCSVKGRPLLLTQAHAPAAQKDTQAIFM